MSVSPYVWARVARDLVFAFNSTAAARWVRFQDYDERLPNVKKTTAAASGAVETLRETLTNRAEQALLAIGKIEANPRLTDDAKAEDIARVGRTLFETVARHIERASTAVRSASMARETIRSARRTDAASQIIDKESAAELRAYISRLDPDSYRTEVRRAVLEGADPAILGALGHAHVALRRRMLAAADLEEETFRRVTSAWDTAENPSNDLEDTLLADLDRSVTQAFTAFEIAGRALNDSGTPAADREAARLVDEVRFGRPVSTLVPDPLDAVPEP